MKEKIWKLLELLNEYELWEDYGDMWEYYYIDTLWNIVDDGWYILKPCEIISKKFWFIKYLVENDKINKHGIPEFYPVSDHCLECVYEWIADNTIMLLSIQKNPIDFLVSLLK